MEGLREYKTFISLRGDYFYCPLSLSLDSYWNCYTDCLHCFLRAMNRTWGKEFRKADPAKVRRKLERGLRNSNPRSDLSKVLRLKKTIRFGNKSDPFHRLEKRFGVSGEILKILSDLKWNTVIQTKGLGVLRSYEKILMEGGKTFIIMAVVMPGLDRDWELLERRRTTKATDRVRILGEWKRRGLRVAVNGEPFIPGYHTVGDFRDTLKFLVSQGIRSYNVYNLHMNDLVLKRLLSLGLDIEKIWILNQDESWRGILRKLLEVADELGVRLGCPDFVNSGRRREPFNTCCGLDADNPMTFNTHYWKQLWLDGRNSDEILEKTYEGYGDLDTARRIVEGTSERFYTLKDIVEDGDGWKEAQSKA